MVSESMTTDEVRTAVLSAAHHVVDPCSAAMGHPISIVDLGLVQRVDVTGDCVTVTVGFTSPCCEHGQRIADATAQQVRRKLTNFAVRVEIDHSLVWSERLASEATQVALSQRRSATRLALGVEPFDWSSQ
jgi:metal-sulfur cluster biosynthetic enzyme